MGLLYTVYIVVTLLGLVMGSFAGATVWRLRARQLLRDKADGEPYDKAELRRLKPLTDTTALNDRSRCLKCGHVLAWYDLLPLMSWLSTKGKCRYCREPIGWFEPLMEAGTASVFLLFSFVWISTFGLQSVGLAVLALWLAAFTMLAILFAYDLKWYLLPDAVMFPLIGLSALIAGVMLKVLHGADVVASLVSIAVSVLILGGLYLLLWTVSKGRWVGFGDVKLGLALGLLLVNWKLALLTLILANLIGTLVVLPGLVAKKLSQTSQVPFGPFLIAGFFISVVAGYPIINGYESFSIWLTSTMLML